MFRSKIVQKGMADEQVFRRGKNLKDQIDPYQLSENVSSYKSIEAARRKRANALFCVVGSLVLFFFGFAALGKGLTGLATFTLTCACLACLVFIYQKVSGNVERAGHYVVYICISLFLYLFITGGYNNTGPLWCYVLSVLILFVLGEKKGAIVNGILIVYMIAAFSMDDSPLLLTSYSKDIVVRFMTTFIAIFAIAMIYERSHSVAKIAMAEVAEQLYAISRIDALSGLWNRRAMRELMEYESMRVRRINKSYSVLFVDIDFFKGINDEFGHDGGDFVLRKMARTLKDSLRGSDTISRWGGEEFVALLPETPGQHVGIIGEKVRKAVEEMEFVYNGGEIPVTVSIGGASFEPEENIDDTINRADKHLYRAKKEGRNRVIA